MLDLTAVTGRNGMRLLDLAIIIWEGNARLAAKEETFPFINNLQEHYNFFEATYKFLYWDSGRVSPDKMDLWKK